MYFICNLIWNLFREKFNCLLPVLIALTSVQNDNAIENSNPILSQFNVRVAWGVERKKTKKTTKILYQLRSSMKHHLVWLMKTKRENIAVHLNPYCNVDNLDLSTGHFHSVKWSSYHPIYFNYTVLIYVQISTTILL